MLKRAIFGAIYVAIILAGILCGNLTLLLLLLLLSTLGVNEFLVMTSPKEEVTPNEAAIALLQRSLDCVGAAVLVIAMWSGQMFYPALVTFMLYLVIRLCLQLWTPSQNAVESLSHSFMAMLYIAFPISLMTWIYSFSPHLLLLLFVLVWINDTFAYLTGRFLGRHKLWERISPKKTWEGFWGGLFFTVATGVGCAMLWPDYFLHLSPMGLGFLAALTSIAGTLGDLVESLLKRTEHVKDSGTLIPGHGGILDRIDSILLVIPTATIFLYFALFYAV